MGKPDDMDLSVEFAGVKMRAPIGVAAQAPFAPASISGKKLAELLLKHVEAGAGYVHTPYTNVELDHPKNRLPTGRFLKAHTPGFGRSGFWVAADSYRIEMRLDESLKLVDSLKKRLPSDVPVIANIMGPGADPGGWAELACKFENAGADIIELDVSCPLPASAAGAVESFSSAEHIPEHAGMLLGDNLALTRAVTAEVVNKTRLPVGVKLTPETGFPRLVGFAEQLKEVGARFITSVNAPLSVAPPDIHNGGKSPYPGLDANTISPAVGPWTRYLCYRNIGTISMFVPGIDQAAVGGLVDVTHVIEAMMLGAKICEFSSGTLWKGWGFISDSLNYLRQYMLKQGYRSLEEFRGLGVQYIKPAEEIDWGLGRLTAAIDPGKCKGCEICANNLCWAITMNENNKATVSEQDCGACALCVAICPSNAATLVEAQTPQREEEFYARYLGQ
ncbi:hypothetical protein [Paradesulfitobacterium ferrireducens]|uniref:hypothetical protein n=1 Tax=Paradesulfitobacterium ferrireducens TaxID=2816476 RepID=UPI001A8F48FC|nr:hypothetical protein [Paradesulfitobacterium ferrireducens]